MAQINAAAYGLDAHSLKLRETFISQYMDDFDGFQACLRMGYGEKHSPSTSQMFLQDAYVLNRILEEKNALGICTEEDVHRRRIISGLYRIANSRKVSAAAQVSALSQLSKILGIEAPVRSESLIHAHETEDVPLTFRVIRAQDGRRVQDAG